VNIGSAELGKACSQAVGDGADVGRTAPHFLMQKSNKPGSNAGLFYLVRRAVGQVGW